MHHVTILLVGLVSGVVSQLPSLSDGERERVEEEKKVKPGLLIYRINRMLTKLAKMGYREDKIQNCGPCVFLQTYGHIAKHFTCVNMMMPCSKIPEHTIRKPCICPGRDPNIKCGVLPNGFKLLVRPWPDEVPRPRGKKDLQSEFQLQLEEDILKSGKMEKNKKRDQGKHQKKYVTKKKTDETNNLEKKMNSRSRQTGEVKGGTKGGKRESKEGNTESKEEIKMKKGEKMTEIRNENISKYLNQSVMQSIEMGETDQLISFPRHRYADTGFEKEITRANLDRGKRNNRDKIFPEMYFNPRKRKYRTKHFDINMMPWVVLLSQWRAEHATTAFDTWCNGFLLDKYFIVTMADCVSQSWSTYRALFFNYLYDQSVHYYERSKNARVRGKWKHMYAKAIHVHPKFSVSGSKECIKSGLSNCMMAYNLALVELKTPIDEPLHPCYTHEPHHSFTTTRKLYTVSIRGHWNQRPRWSLRNQYVYGSQYDWKNGDFNTYKFGSETRYMSGRKMYPYTCKHGEKLLFPHSLIYYHHTFEGEPGNPYPVYTENDLGSPVVRYNKHRRLEIAGILVGWITNCETNYGTKYPQAMVMIDLHATELRDWIQGIVWKQS